MGVAQHLWTAKHLCAGHDQSTRNAKNSHWTSNPTFFISLSVGPARIAQMAAPRLKE